MSEPALHQAHAHQAIHESCLSGAVSKTEVLEKLLKAGHYDLANHLVEYWETRVISHADTEEESFYKEIVSEKPHLEKAVTVLTCAHDLLRIILKEIKEQKEKEGVTAELLKPFYAFITVNAIHSEDEIK